MFLPQKINIILKGVGGNFGGDGYLYGLDDGGGFVDIHLSPSSSNYNNKYLQLFNMSIIPQ